MTSKVLNFLWLNLELPPPPDPADGKIRAPLPAKYIGNVRKAGKKHPAAEIDLWVDSKRLTERQMAYLKESIEKGMQNVHLKDLRSIPAYDKENLYNKGETDQKWRDCGQTSLIWRQVDAAKVLVSLQGNFDQTFFADLDHAHLDIDGHKVQDRLKENGLLIGSMSRFKMFTSVENQLWGFDRSRRGFFEDYHAKALKCAYYGDNAWSALVYKVHNDLECAEGKSLKRICLPIGSDLSSAKHPGNEWCKGKGKAAKLSLISVGKTFNQSSASPAAVQRSSMPVNQKVALKL